MKILLSLFILLISTQVSSKPVKIIENQKLSFKPFLCNDLKTENLRINQQNKCLIIQKLRNTYQIKSSDFDKNTWQSPQIIKYLNNEGGGKKILPILGIMSFNGVTSLMINLFLT